jgi:hypothetical protein
MKTSVVLDYVILDSLIIVKSRFLSLETFLRAGGGGLHHGILVRVSSDRCYTEEELSVLMSRMGFWFTPLFLSFRDRIRKDEAVFS